MEKIGNEQFRHDLRALTAKYITSSSSFRDYCGVTEGLVDEERRLSKETEKFSDHEVNSSL
ncbi:hypothetical protein [Bradyrhizobium sp. DASA03120]|uniref:hypothetical protein n=1 Tax=Bradyrhizobium sp. SMVTL-02 TaxID=3395917 RepID=UPI003F6E64AB